MCRKVQNMQQIYIHSLLSILGGCCVFVFLETLLNNGVTDFAIQLDWRTCNWADWALVEGGMTNSSGLCVNINDTWCADAVVVWKLCSPLVEFVVIKYCPIYILREFITIMLAAVYILPISNNRNRGEALKRHCTSVSSRQPILKLFLFWLRISTMQT